MGCAEAARRFGALLFLSLALGCTAPNPGYRVSSSDAAPGEAGPPDDAEGSTPDAGQPDDAEGSTPDAGQAADPICPASDGDLALCLRFENDLLDESQRRGAVSGAGVAFVAGPSGMAASVAPGSSLRAATSPGLSLDTFTLELWIRPRVLPAAGDRAGLIDREGDYGLFVLPDGSIECTVSGDSVLAPAKSAQPDVWTSVACTLGVDTLAIWIDGRRADQTTAPDLTPVPAADVALGLNSPSGDNFDGLLDNVRIWRSTRTATQICAAAQFCR